MAYLSSVDIVKIGDLTLMKIARKALLAINILCLFVLVECGQYKYIQANDSELVQAKYNYEITRIGNQYYLNVSSLYLYDKYGIRLDCGWYRENDLEFISGYNFFSARVNGDTIQVESSKYKGSWQAQVQIANQTLELQGLPYVAGDLFNGYYHRNTLVFDYGVVKRYIRLIEGSITSMWEITKPLKGDLDILVNATGNLTFRKAQAKDSNQGNLTVTTQGLNEHLDGNALTESVHYPVYIFDSPETFYPDADPETSGFDCSLKKYGAGAGSAWSVLHNAATADYVQDSQASNNCWYIRTTTSPGQFSWIIRSEFIIDTSALPDDAIIQSAVFSVYGTAATHDLSSWTMGVYSANPASDTGGTNTDYAAMGTALYSNTISDVSVVTGGYNDFSFNDTGKAAISRDGLTKLAIRNSNHDAANVEPSWVSDKSNGLTCYYSEQGFGYQPKLVITYTIPAAPEPPYNFTANQYDVDKYSFSWTDNETADGAQVYISYSGGDAYLIYDGLDASLNVTGLDLNSTQYKLSFADYNTLGSSDNIDFTIGGDSMQINFVFPSFYIMLVFGLVLLLISAFIKRILIYVALIPVWLAIIWLSSRYADMEAIQAASGIVFIYAILQIRKIRGKNVA